MRLTDAVARFRDITEGSGGFKRQQGKNKNLKPGSPAYHAAAVRRDARFDDSEDRMYQSTDDPAKHKARGAAHKARRGMKTKGK